MKIKVLGCSGAEFPGHNPPGFLLDERILFDAGSLTNVLDAKRQAKIEYVFVTHSHLDHVKGIPFLADSIAFGKYWHRVNIFSIPSVIRALKKNLLNGSIWPDFTSIPGLTDSILKLMELKAGQPLKIGNYTITAYRVNHSVPAVGYLVKDRGEKRFFYTGDTGPSDLTWNQLREDGIDCLIIEVSFPDRMEEVAIKTGHLTPKLLRGALSTISPRRVYVTHLKPRYLKETQRELRKLKLPNLKLLRDGETITI
jgi:ribonuclease BN (tRNA processing enzyme)